MWSQAGPRSRPASSPVWPGTPIAALATLTWAIYSPADTGPRTLPGAVAGHVPVKLRNPMTAPGSSRGEELGGVQEVMSLRLRTHVRSQGGISPGG